MRARGWLWRVQRAWGAVGCRVIEIDPLHRDAPHIGALLDPFDRVEALPAGSRWRPATRGSLPQHIARLTGAWPDQPLAALGSMRVPLWTHQRAPALAIVGGHATRVVIADQVGLGKTLSAALVLAELSARGICQRALVLVPAGLRDQWRDELETRAGLQADVVDAAALAERLRHRPAGESPWTAAGIAIVSMDSGTPGVGARRPRRLAVGRARRRRSAPGVVRLGASGGGRAHRVVQPGGAAADRDAAFGRSARLPPTRRAGRPWHGGSVVPSRATRCRGADP